MNTLQTIYDSASKEERELPLMLEAFGKQWPVKSQSTSISEDEHGKHPATALVLSAQEPT